MRKDDLIKTLNTYISAENECIMRLKNDKNPQVVEMVNHAKGMVDAYEAVLYYAEHKGSKVMFY